jgi:FAD/FMN-containing dehydrogenase
VAGGLEVGRRLLDAVPNPAAVLATPEAVELRLEGWPEEVERQVEVTGRVEPVSVVADEDAFPSESPWEASAVVAEAAVPPSRLPELLSPPFPDLLGPHLGSWGALLGVGIAWVGLSSSHGELGALRERARTLGGTAPAIKGPGGLGPDVPSGLDVHRRLKAAFDPAGVLAPGRFWGGI